MRMKNVSVDFNNLIWLHCDSQLRGKVVVRHGKRKEVTAGEKGVFCPQQSFPRDRVSIKACEKCSRFKGYSKIQQNQGGTTSTPIGKELDDTKWKMPKSEDKKKIITITDENIKEAEDEQKKWKDEETKEE